MVHWRLDINLSAASVAPQIEFSPHDTAAIALWNLPEWPLPMCGSRAPHFAQKMSFIDLLGPRVSKLFLKLPREILVSKKCSFFCQTAGWSLTASTNRDSVTCFLSKLRSPSGEQQFLGNSHPISKVHPIVGRFSKPPHCSAQLVPESGDGRWCGQSTVAYGKYTFLLRTPEGRYCCARTVLDSGNLF